MNDLISRSALVKSIKNTVSDKAVKVLALVKVNTAPAVDAVEVVRCKDCIHYEKYPDYANECWNNAGMLNVYDDGFCSYGERRTE